MTPYANASGIAAATPDVYGGLAVPPPPAALSDPVADLPRAPSHVALAPPISSTLFAPSVGGTHAPAPATHDADPDDSLGTLITAAPHHVRSEAHVSYETPPPAPPKDAREPARPPPAAPAPAPASTQPQQQQQPFAPLAPVATVSPFLKDGMLPWEEREDQEFSTPRPTVRESARYSAASDAQSSPVRHILASYEAESPGYSPRTKRYSRRTRASGVGSSPRRESSLHASPSVTLSVHGEAFDDQQPTTPSRVRPLERGSYAVVTSTSRRRNDAELLASPRRSPGRSPRASPCTSPRVPLAWELESLEGPALAPPLTWSHNRQGSAGSSPVAF